MIGRWLALGLMLAALAPAPALAAAPAAAKDAVQAQRLAEAERLLTDHLAARGDDEESRFLLARVQAWQGKWPAALEHYERLLAMRPYNADYLLGKGQAHLWAGQPEEALPVLERARTLSPAYEEVWRLEILTMGQLGPDHRRRGLALQEEARERFPHRGWDLLPAPRAPRLELQVGTHYDQLSRDMGDWHGNYVEALGRIHGLGDLHGTVREARRFGYADQEIAASLGFEPQAPWTAGLAASFSPSAQILPRYGVGARVARSFPGGVGAELGLQHTAYRLGENTRATLMLEKYWLDFRLAYTGSVTRIGPGELPLGHMATMSYHYGDRSQLALAAAIGREMEFVGPERLVTTDVGALSLRGVHWFDPAWAIAPELHWVEQGTVYRRLGGHVAIRRAF